MPSLACPNCRTKLTAPAEVLGQIVRCTTCGSSFKASPNLSPYLEGLPPLPKDRRPLILAGAVALALLLTTGLVLGLNWLGDDSNDNKGSGLSDHKAVEQAVEAMKPKMVTKDGIPIEMPALDDPLALPPPGEVRLSKSGELIPAANSKDDVTLTSVKWNVAPGQRKLEIAYSFRKGMSPDPKLHTLKLRLEGDRVINIPMDATMAATGVITLNAEATLSDRPGRLPKVEAWVERNVGAGLGQKISNTAGTD